MTQAYWSCDWHSKAREMDLDEMDKVIYAFQYERGLKLAEIMWDRIRNADKKH